MRISDSAISVEPLELRMSIEDCLAPEVVGGDTSGNFEFDCQLPSPGHEHAWLWISIEEAVVLVEIQLCLRDLRALNKNWDGVTYPKPSKSPRPYETELQDHGEEYKAIP